MLSCCLLQFLAGAQIFFNAPEAFLQAKDKHHPILLIFAGSDWCQPCIRFEKTILSDPFFMNYANTRLVLLKADFPQRKRLLPSLVAQNEALAEKFNPNGAFPLVLLLKPDQQLLATLEYENQTPGSFIEQIRSQYALAMWKEYKRQARLMGSAFEFIIPASSAQEAEMLMDQSIREVKRLESLLTEFHPDSQTSLLNRLAGIAPLQVEKEVFDLIQRSVDLSRLTDGAFDITAGALKALYNFKGEDFSLPDKSRIAKTLQRVGYKKIKLSDSQSIYLEVKGMHISFAAIGKGYAAGKVKMMLLQNGVTCAAINASGDLTAWGTRPNGKPWKIGIANPDEPSKIILWLPLNGMSVATSGNYIQYFEINGVRYSHNIDPKTGYPVKGIKSVSIISPSAELSDALATAVSVMGKKAGLRLIDQLPQTHCIIIDENNKIFGSKKIIINHVDQQA